MPRNAPTIMVSSTCYDLKQVRQDLSRFIEEMGYNPLLSEFDYFPIDPDLDTVENCRRRVEQDADIMVLIIGGRYGYVDPDSDKSITNLEYLTARAKGIPIYTFVDKGILPLLTTWERNPDADYSDTVSNTKVFEFIKQVRGKWTFEFEHAQNIVQTLKYQFAHQMLEGLNLRKQIRAHQSEIPVGISGKAIRLILEKPYGWEQSFFAQVLTDEVSKHGDTYQEYRLGLVFSKGELIMHYGFVEWVKHKGKEALRMAQVLSDLINVHLIEALSPPGVPANLEATAFVARKIASIHKEALDWVLELRRSYAEECIQPAVNQLSKGLDDLIEQVQLYGPDMLSKIQSHILNSDSPAIEAQLKVTTSLGEDFADLVMECLQNCSDQTP